MGFFCGFSFSLITIRLFQIMLGFILKNNIIFKFRSYCTHKISYIKTLKIVLELK